MSIVERDFYMGRHGETCHNATGIVTTQHTMLSAEGVRQGNAMNAVYKALPDGPENYYLVASGLPRAQDTLGLMTGGRKPDAVDQRLNERDNGVLQGNATQKWFNEQRETDLHFLDGVEKAQNGSAYRDQVVSGVNEHLNAIPVDKKPVFIAHHGTLGRMASEMGYKGMKFKNATLYHFIPDAATHHWTIAEVKLEQGKLEEVPLAHAMAAATQHPFSQARL